MMPSPGDTIDGRFRIERVVGQGGMGIVVDAVNLHLDQHVALKFLRPDKEQSAEVIARFEREVRAAVKLRSEHVARVSDVGSHPQLGPYMVMELLDGSTLADLLTSSGPFPIHRAAEYIIHACEGLAEAHARGIVHQDVKPANLFLVHGSDGRPLVKVLDFGISKLIDAPRNDRPDFTTTTTGQRSSNLGTPHYLSPEQLRSGAEVDRRADVWALGCVLFELVTGVKAFSAPRFTALVANILEAARAEVPEAIELSPALVGVIDRCVEKDRDNRYGTTAELALALLPFARRRAHSVAARAVAHVNAGGLDRQLTMPSSMPPPPTESSASLMPGALRAPRVPDLGDDAVLATHAPSGSSAPPAPAPAPANHRTILVLLALLLLLLGAGLVLLLTRSPPPVAPVALAPPSASNAVASGPLPTPEAAFALATSASSTAPTPSGEMVRPRVPSVGVRPTAPAVASPPAPSERVPDSEIRRTR